MACRSSVPFLLAAFLVMPLACHRETDTQISVSNGDGQTQITINGQTINLKETAKETLRETFKTTATPKVVVDLFNGAMAVEAAADNTVSAEVTRSAVGETAEEAKANLKLIDVQMKQEGDVVRIIVRRADDGQKSGKQDIEAIKKQLAVRGADAVVKVPAGALLDLKTAFGDVKVQGIAGRVEAVSSSGGVTVTGGKGELKLESSFGKIAVDGQNTNVHATTKSGDVTVKGAKGPLEVSSGFGSVAINGSSDKVMASSNSGDVNVIRASGPVKAMSGFGSVLVDGGDAVQAESRSGKVTVKAAKGSITAKSGFGDVDVEQAPVGATVETNSGTIRIKGAKGTVKLTSGFGGIDAEVTDAIINANSKSGDVKIRGSLAEGQHVLHSGFGNVTLTLPSDARFSVDAETHFGKATTDFALQQSGKRNEQHFAGVVGDNPKATLKLSSNSGDVEVKKKQ